ncbi:class II SORL domain-containing protein [Infirmifilum lucidum]|uniref:Class II SORL domain-containing protein n=1 Tax=Infirmifilum lucidum TaxID=2776706 RepID=A0A7L9FG76_9CREN|nr:class II SORL domain-containing protein [Infirmifilum lucidum]QOJ78621.1 class II SORL domain-containing protein [Infirmifilum lucidum]
MTKKFGDLIYTPETASGEAISKVETHTPRIEAPEQVKAGEPFYIKVAVGPHPNTVQHSIRWVEVYFQEEGRPFNPVLLARVVFEPEYAEPDITLKVVLKKSGVIHAVEYCNLHGLWEGRKEIKVI